MTWQPPSPAASLQALAASSPQPIFVEMARSDIYPAMPRPGPEDWLNGPGEKDRPGQSLAAWRTSRRRPSARQNVIYLLPLGDFDGEVDVNVLVDCVSAYYYGLEVRCLEAVPTAVLKQKVKQRKSQGYGQQLFTTDVHTLIEGMRSQHSDAFMIMGFTMFDLYPRESWNFCFGQASPAKGTGVFSFARYRGGTAKHFTRRCLMVLCHEIGHLFGIKHCIWWGCCMNGSNHDAESDGRPFAMCPTDTAKISEAIGKRFDLLKREKALVACLTGAGLTEMARWHEANLEQISALLASGCGKTSAGPLPSAGLRPAATPSRAARSQTGSGSPTTVSTGQPTTPRAKSRASTSQPRLGSPPAVSTGQPATTGARSMASRSQTRLGSPQYRQPPLYRSANR
eukprot:TRINITY_DN32466_c0_g1_i1.p1 TRINITY_DN32466_c0_g1~~TRINITY_DN32466_c0_g1_i1.p1  ORF type:complete len:419 (+),score=22.54 TRINITY_DN32466_c0_g1_i1:69-1259(+)